MGSKLKLCSMWQNGASMKRQRTIFNCVTQEEGTTKRVNVTNTVTVTVTVRVM